MERQQAQGKQVAFRADAAFAKPEIYEALEERNVASRSIAEPVVPTGCGTWSSEVFCINELYRPSIAAPHLKGSTRIFLCRP